MRRTVPDYGAYVSGLARPRPRLVKFWSEDQAKYLWKCRLQYQDVTGFGATASQAFYDWLDRRNSFEEIPRRGHWNRQSAMRWFLEGCPPINYYIGNKRVVGFSARRDVILLQG